jgi:hypothetical protein
MFQLVTRVLFPAVFDLVAASVIKKLFPAPAEPSI